MFDLIHDGILSNGYMNCLNVEQKYVEKRYRVVIIFCRNMKYLIILVLMIYKCNI